MRINPCYHCQFENNCELNQSHKSKFKSINTKTLCIRSVIINCTTYWKQFNRGDRVLFTRYNFKNYNPETDESFYDEEKIKGTFVNWSKRYALIVLDKYITSYRGNEHKFIKVYPKNHYGSQKIEKLPEERWNICEFCNNAYENYDVYCKKCNNEMMICEEYLDEYRKQNQNFD